MRVGLLTHEPFYPPSGGGSAEAVYLARELVRRGHAVEVFCPEVADAAAVEARCGVRLHLFRTWKMGRYAALRNLKYLAYPAALTRFVARQIAAGTARPDVLVSQHAISAVAAGRLRVRLGVPVVMNFLDCLTGFMETWPAWKMPPPVVRALRRYELSLPVRYRADAVLTVSDPLRDLFVEAGFPAKRIRPIYYGLDAALFRPGLAEDAALSGPPVVVMHGSFDEHHLGPIAVEAAVRLAELRPEARWRFVGRETTGLRRFVAAVRRRRPGFAPELTGFIPYEQVPAAVAGGSVGVTPYEPSTGTHCAFVAKTVEYLALGLPVVSTPLESARRYYAGWPAVKLAGADGGSVARALANWLATPVAERRALAAVAGGRVRTELDWAAVCGRAAEVIGAQAAGGGEGRAVHAHA